MEELGQQPWVPLCEGHKSNYHYSGNWPCHSNQDDRIFHCPMHQWLLWGQICPAMLLPVEDSVAVIEPCTDKPMVTELSEFTSRKTKGKYRLVYFFKTLFNIP